MTFGQLPQPVRLALAGALLRWFCLLTQPGRRRPGVAAVRHHGSLPGHRDPGLTRVAVGDSRIAAVVPIGNSQIVINGKGPGHTSIFVWEEGRRLTYEVTVTEQSLDDIARMLRTAIDLPNVQVISFGKTIVLCAAPSRTASSSSGSTRSWAASTASSPKARPPGRHPRQRGHGGTARWARCSKRSPRSPAPATSGSTPTARAT